MAEGGEASGECVRSEDLDRTETAHIAETQLHSVIEYPRDPVKTVRWVSDGIDRERPRHAEMDDKCEVVIEIEDEKFRTAAYCMDATPDDSGVPMFAPRVPDRFGIGDTYRRDAPTGKMCRQPATDGFDFGKFGQRRFPLFTLCVTLVVAWLVAQNTLTVLVVYYSRCAVVTMPPARCGTYSVCPSIDKLLHRRTIVEDEGRGGVCR